jgi:hypothetical protein
MSEILNDVKDFSVLQEYWNNTSSGSKPEKLIEKRMSEVLEDILPNIKDFSVLQEHWES